MPAGIYTIFNTITNDMYIGSAINIKARWKNHRTLLSRNKHHSIILQRAYNKYGCDALDYSIIEYIDNDSSLIDREQVWLDFFRPKYNILKVAGSPSGFKMSNETRRKMSLSRTGKKRAKFTEEHRKNISLAKIGKKLKLTPEGREKLLATHTGKAYCLGRKLTEEHKRKLSERLIGNSRTLGMKFSPEAYASRRGPRKNKKQMVLI